MKDPKKPEVTAASAAPPHELRIIFPTEEAKRLFALWLCNSGEQHYFDAMQDSQTPSLRIGYHGPEDDRYSDSDARRYGPFLSDNTLRVEICED
jgi:hypothetical protein